ncbi:hypothetical protein DMR_13430 [Solidesulfovibrio magneticus RS-1]|uniref:Phospholipase C/D domain-containing protein n=2 Tax=Solidesulfovibrio TaxID=2910984 RepID=C4XMP3_SOLM1|nr:hypothetical protein DMR_13430 [Solidesulfovibrio magneticus RS-1]
MEIDNFMCLGIGICTSQSPGHGPGQEAAMPGAYAHITLASRCVNPSVLGSLELDTETVGKLMQQVGYFQLGAISPDMPYLVGLGTNKQAIAWADRMHWKNVSERIGAGVAAVSNLEGDVQNKCLAWLLGFVEHIIFDVFMHPVVNNIAGGAYSDETKGRHQWCEMNQDVYILMRECLITDISNAKIVEAVIKTLHASCDKCAMDQDVRSVFDEMLRTADSDLYADNVPDIDGWFASFVSKMQIQEGNSILSGIGRHVNWHLVYPAAAQRNQEFLENLPVPENTPLSHLRTYDALFDHARSLVNDHWRKVTRAVIGIEPYNPNWFAGWNLDTGEKTEEISQFWRQL